METSMMGTDVHQPVRLRLAGLVTVEIGSNMTSVLRYVGMVWTLNSMNVMMAISIWETVVTMNAWSKKVGIAQMEQTHKQTHVGTSLQPSITTLSQPTTQS